MNSMIVACLQKVVMQLLTEPLLDVSSYKSDYQAFYHLHYLLQIRYTFMSWTNDWIKRRFVITAIWSQCGPHLAMSRSDTPRDLTLVCAVFDFILCQANQPFLSYHKWFV